MKNEIENLVDQFERKHMSRRELVASLLGLAGTLAASPIVRAQQAPVLPPSAIGKSMNHVSISVADVNRSAEFYNRVLGMEIISRPANGGLNMGLGGESFLGLYQLANPGTMHHLCIGVDNYDPDAMAARLLKHGITASIRASGAVISRTCSRRRTKSCTLLITRPARSACSAMRVMACCTSSGVAPKLTWSAARAAA